MSLIRRLNLGFNEFSSGLLLVFVLALSGCADNNNEAPSDQSSPIETTISASIGPDGGSVSARSSAGVSYTLVVPFGALTEATNIQLTPLADVGDSPLSRDLLGAVLMEPSGLTFKSAATLRIEATATPGAGEVLVGFSGANDGSNIGLKPAVVVESVTEISINHFSTAGSSTLTAEEVQQLPVPLLDNPAEQFMDELMRKSSVAGGNPVQLGIDIADGFRRWYQEQVKPQLDFAIVILEANLSTLNDVLNDPAIEAYKQWINARVAIEGLTNGSTNANSLLADLDAEARPLVARLIRDRIDLTIARCPILANVTVLSFTSYYQNIAVELVLATEEFGLDNVTFLSKVNSCVRPVLDTIELPSPLIIGTPVSLDAQAKLVFIDTPDPVAAPFEFTITPTGATVQHAIGKSDATGQFTTVFTPGTEEVEFVVQACLVLEFLNPNEGSDICASQTVSSVIVAVGPAVATLTQAQITAYAGPIIRDSCNPVAEEQAVLVLGDVAPLFPPMNADATWTGSAFINRIASANAQISASLGTDDNGSLQTLSAALSGTITTDVPATRNPSCEIVGEGNAEFLFTVSGGSMSYSISESPVSPADHGSDNADSALFLSGTTPTLLYGLDAAGTLQGTATGVLDPGSYRYVLHAFYANSLFSLGSDSGTASNTGTLTLVPLVPAP